MFRLLLEDLPMQVIFKIIGMTVMRPYPLQVHPALDHVSASVSQSQRSLGTVAALLECQPQHQYYMAIVQHTCTTTM